jgi:Rrf2 family protein
MVRVDDNDIEQVGGDPEPFMRLTKQTTYALRILLHCAQAGDQQVKAGDIAKAYQITEFNVLKIIPLLVHGGFVKTTRGRKGGLRLARPPQEIRIGDVVRLTEQTRITSEAAPGEDDGMIAKSASINRILGNALGAFIEVLDQNTLQDLLGQRPRRSGKGGSEAGDKPVRLDLAGLNLAVSN